MASNPATVTVECFSMIPAVDVTVVTDEADNCTGTPTVAFVSDDITSASCDGATTTVTRTYSVTDCSGNSINVTQTINVDDTTNPTASNPANIYQIGCNMPLPAPDPNIVIDEADNCSEMPVVSFVSDVSIIIPTCTEKTIRTYSVSDCSGNITFVTQSIFRKVDTIAPVILEVPADETINYGTPLTIINPTVLDGCDVGPELILANRDSSAYDCATNSYKITRTWQAQDACGNLSSLITHVTTVICPPNQVDAGVYDTLCLSDSPLVLNASIPGGSYSGIGIVGGSFDPTIAGIGTHIVSYSVLDIRGCMISDTASLVVEDCSTLIGYQDSCICNTDGSYTVTLHVEGTNPTFTFSGVSTNIVGLNNGDTFEIGDPEVEALASGLYHLTLTITVQDLFGTSWTVTDAVGNVETYTGTSCTCIFTSMIGGTQSIIWGDSNENGLYDPADTYTDLNGNGQYDFGEPYVDFNGDGQYSSTGEVGVSGVVIQLFDAGPDGIVGNGDDIAIDLDSTISGIQNTVYTDSLGYFSFTNMPVYDSNGDPINYYLLFPTTIYVDGGATEAVLTASNLSGIGLTDSLDSDAGADGYTSSFQLSTGSATTNIGAGYINIITTPVVISHFALESPCDSVKIEWTVERDKEVAKYVIQRSVYANNWVNVDTITSMHNIFDQSYTVYDQYNATSSTSYRLLILKENGTIEYSNILTTQNECDNSIESLSISPNPAQEGYLNFQIYSHGNQDIRLILIDEIGRIIIDKATDVQFGYNTKQLDVSLIDNAIYFATVIDEDGKLMSATKIVVRNK